MQINRVNNQSPSFGIKYVNPRKWSPKVLDTFMNSKLAKEIDAKYPKAEAEWVENYVTNSKLLSVNQLKINLTKDKKLMFFDRCKLDPDFPRSYSDCSEKINKTTLSDLEVMYSKRQSDLQKRKKNAMEIEQIYVRAEENNAKIEAAEVKNTAPEEPKRSSFLDCIRNMFKTKKP